MEATRPDGNLRRAVNGTAAGGGGGGGGGGNDNTAKVRPLPLPPSKTHYRAGYRPLPPPVRSRSRSRRCSCCVCFLWLILVLVALVFVAAFAAGVFYVIYRPLPPSFTVSSLRLSVLNVTSGDTLTVTSRMELTVTAHNPNGKLVLDYGDVAVAAYSDGVAIGDGAIGGFVHGTDNTTVIKVAVASTGWSLEPSDAEDLKRRRKGKYPLEIDFDTNARVWVGGLKTKRVGVRASCDGIEAAVAKGNSTAAAAAAAPPSSSPPDDASPPAVKCKVKFHIKIFSWTI